MILNPELVLAKVVFSVTPKVLTFFFLATLYSLWDLCPRESQFPDQGLSLGHGIKAQNPNHH